MNSSRRSRSPASGVNIVPPRPGAGADRATGAVLALLLVGVALPIAPFFLRNLIHAGALAIMAIAHRLVSRPVDPLLAIDRPEITFRGLCPDCSESTQTPRKAVH